MIPIQQQKKKSLKDILVTNLTDFNRTSRLLFDSFYGLATQQQHQNQQQQQNINPVQFMNLLIESDKNLQNSLKQLEQHQKYQNEICSVQKEIQEKDKLIASLASNLKNIESFLENTILQDSNDSNVGGSSSGMNNETNKILISKKSIEFEQKQQKEKNEITPDELISYAHKISGTTSAPYGYQPNTPLITLYKPPAPQDEMMRASLLFRKLPINILKYYGLGEGDISTSTLSPILQSQQVEQQLQQLQQQQQQDIEMEQTMSQQQQSQQQIITPPMNQPIQTFTGLDLDLNSDLESSDEDEDEDEEDEDAEKSSDEEVDWE